LHEGVGSTVIARAAGHLKARFSRTWTAEGLAFELEVPKEAIGIAAED
jgi:hypothetical protein